MVTAPGHMKPRGNIGLTRRLQVARGGTAKPESQRPDPGQAQEERGEKKESEGSAGEGTKARIPIHLLPPPTERHFHTLQPSERDPASHEPPLPLAAPPLLAAAEAVICCPDATTAPGPRAPFARHGACWELPAEPP